MPKYYEFEVSLQELQPRIWLLDGERAAPPEDCGGTPGYARMVRFVETGEDTYDDDPDGLAVWLDGWRPDAFDIAKTKAGFDR